MSINKKSKVFISYNKETGNTIAEAIEKSLSQIAVVVRDKSTTAIEESVVNFINVIRNQDKVVLIITDRYLKSIDCMFEVSEAMKVDDWEEKIIPIVSEEVKDIYDVTKIVKYQKYWESKEKTIEAAIKDIGEPVS